MMGDAVAELMREDVLDDDLERKAAHAAAHEEASCLADTVGAQQCTRASGSGETPDAGAAAASTGASSWEDVLAECGMVDISSSTNLRFADKENPSTVTLMLPTVKWASGKISLKCVCRRGHGCCVVWFNNVRDEAHRLELVRRALIWGAHGRHASAAEHSAQGQTLKNEVA